MFIDIPFDAFELFYLNRTSVDEEMRGGPFLEPAAEALRDALGAARAAPDARTHGRGERTAGGQRLQQPELLWLLVAAQHLVSTAEDDRVRRARPRDAAPLAAATRVHEIVR